MSFADQIATLNSSLGILPVLTFAWAIIALTMTYHTLKDWSEGINDRFALWTRLWCLVSWILIVVVVTL